MIDMKSFYKHKLKEFFVFFLKISADQTPTPTTRLIRNCEEFGLFDDLKHVNPFEETFRQAIDCKAKRPTVLLTTQKSLEVIKCNDEDTLHTPFIIPYNTITDNKDETTNCDKPNQEIINESNSDKKPIVIVTDESTPSDDPIIVSENIDDKIDIKMIIDCNADLTLAKTVKIIEKTKITTNDEVTQKIFRKICPKPIVPLVNVTNPIKEKIRESLLKLRTIIPDDESDAKVPIASFHIPPAKELSCPKVEIKTQTFKRNATTFQDNSIGERNREAAKRYRNKQKMLHDTLQQRNKQLEAENSMLKKQLQLFKKAHAHCSVSQL